MASAMLPRAQKTRRKVDRPVKAAPITIVSTMSVSDAYVAIVSASLAHLEANEAGVLSGIHPEFLHQMRVALRRLRSAMSVFRRIGDATHAATSEMRWVAGQLGAARDWDVFVFDTLPQITKAFPGVHGMSVIRRHSMQRRRTAWAKAQRAVACERYHALKTDLRRSTVAATAAAPERGNDGQPTDDLHQYAARVLERRYRKVCKRDHELGEQSWDELHALRIAVKKLRYPVEFFSPLFDLVSATHLRSRLMTVQETLGLINDGVTAQRMVETAVPSAEPDAARAAALVSEWADGRSRALRGDFDAAWKAFRAAPVFW